MVWIAGLVIIDLVWSLILFWLFIGSQTSFICGFLFGLFCFIISIGILMRNETMRRLFLKGSLVLSLMSILNLLIFTGKDVQKGFRMSILDVAIFSIIYILIPLTINFVII